jgi:hypothetical protein
MNVSSIVRTESAAFFNGNGVQPKLDSPVASYSVLELLVETLMCHEESSFSPLRSFF